MKYGKVEIPDALTDDLRDNRLVVFAGAGVSRGKPARLPDFKCLTNKISEGESDTKREYESHEQFLGRLHDKGVNIYNLAKNVLSPKGLKPTPLHCDLLRLYGRGQPVRLVTTNFDLLFEEAAKEIFDSEPEIFHAPALPLGHQFSGIIHVHGCICHQDQMVLTDRDFGRAYLNEGWARRFLLGLFDTFTILFVGYSHEDTVMNYLVRALPPKREFQRYALVKDSENLEHWHHLGIETICYPQHENDYSELYNAVGELSAEVQSGKVGWHRKISTVAKNPPPSPDKDDEIDNLITRVLKDEVDTKGFTKSDPPPEWIEWLDERGHLTSLFGNGQLRDSERTLASWLANQYLKEHSDLMFLLIGRHRTRLHPTFWNYIANSIAWQWKIESNNETAPDTTILSRWISLLLSTAPDEGETPDGLYVCPSDNMALIARHCIAHGMVKDSLLIFDAMARSRISIKENRYSSRSEKDEDLQSLLGKEFRLSLDVPLDGDYNELNELWEKGLKPNLSEIAQPLLERVIWSLDHQYVLRHTWGKATRSSEYGSTSRHAIEDHDQNVDGHDIDVLIDVARDCLDWLTSNEPEVVAQWCSRLVISDAPLLRRLAVHSLSQSKNLTPDEKIQWLLERIDLYEYSIGYEVNQVVKQAYPGTSVDCRKALIKKVQSYCWPHPEHPEHEEITAREHFDWFQSFINAAPDCVFAQQAMDNVLAKHPNVRPQEHPEPEDITPLVPEELLSNPTPDSINQFSSLEAPAFRREMERLAEAIKHDSEKGMKLANSLVADGRWDVNLWRVLIDTWPKMELGINEHRQVFKCLANTELYSEFGYEISDWLYALVKKDGPSYAFELLPQANQIAAALWKSLDRPDSIDTERGWFDVSVSYPVWGLVNFWLSAASLWRKEQDQAPSTLSEEYRQALLTIIRDSSPIGGLGKSILASNLGFLLAVDEEWTREHLLPLFELASADFQAAWDGFVTVGRLSPPVAEALKKLFLGAVTRISTGLLNQRYEFVECYIVMLIYVVDDVFGAWIPKLFGQNSQLSQRLKSEPKRLRDDNFTIPDIFALKMAKCLRHMDDTEKQELWERWLKDYWDARLNGKYAPLTANEANLMLDWLPELSAQFPEAVGLTIKNEQKPSLKHTRIFACLITDKTWENHPVAVARLLIYLWSKDTPYWYRDSVLAIIEPLLESEISSELKQQLEDILIELK